MVDFAMNSHEDLTDTSQDNHEASDGSTNDNSDDKATDDEDTVS
jgi:hypothetical protein